MTTTMISPPPRTDVTPAGAGRRTALVAGLLYLLTFAASMPQLSLFDSVIHDRDYLTRSGGDTALRWGALLEIVTAAACVGTAVVLYPVIRRASRTAAIGFVTSRVVEAVLILVGVVSLLTVASLHAEYAGAGPGGAVAVTGDALVTLRQWTFLVGPGLIPGFNALFLGYALHRSRLVPRVIPTVGLVGAPLIIASAIVTVFGGWEQMSVAGSLCALPIAAWEFSLGVWLTVKGFRTGAPHLDTPSSRHVVTAGAQVMVSRKDRGRH